MKTLQERVDAFQESVKGFFDKQIAIINDPRVPQKDRDEALILAMKVFNDLVGMLKAYEQIYGEL